MAFLRIYGLIFPILIPLACYAGGIGILVHYFKPQPQLDQLDKITGIVQHTTGEYTVSQKTVQYPALRIGESRERYGYMNWFPRSSQLTSVVRNRSPPNGLNWAFQSDGCSNRGHPVSTGDDFLMAFAHTHWHALSEHCPQFPRIIGTVIGTCPTSVLRKDRGNSAKTEEYQ